MPTVEEFIIQPGKSMQRNVYLAGKLQREFPAVSFGEEFTEKTMDGKTTKGKITQESDTKVIRHDTFEGGQKADVVIEVVGDELHTTLKSGDVVCTRKYKRAQ